LERISSSLAGPGPAPVSLDEYVTVKPSMGARADGGDCALADEAQAESSVHATASESNLMAASLPPTMRGVVRFLRRVSTPHDGRWFRSRGGTFGATMSDAFPIRVRFPLHWGEMDSLGHANNARFFTWFESARIELFRRVGLPGGPGTTGPILATTTCDFLQPVVYPADLVVSTRVRRIGTTSIEMEYTLARADVPETVLARGSSVVVLVDYATMQKVAVSDALRDAIAKLG
jgi:acyl-CoA thioester hydrolase